MKSILFVAAQLAIVSHALDLNDEEDELELGKVVAWIISGVLTLIVIAMICTYCICSERVAS